MDLFKCYEILGVSRGCTWEELRMAYRRLIQKHHPDRHHQQPDEQLAAKERMLELNKAFDTLAEYYKKNGQLPADAQKKPFVSTHYQPSLQTINPKTSNRTTYTPSKTKPTKSNQTVRRTSLSLVILTTILGYYFLWGEMPRFSEPYSVTASDKVNFEENPSILNGPQNTSPQAQMSEEIDNQQNFLGPGVDQQTAPSTNQFSLGMQEEISESPFFTQGDTLGKVFEVQGVPTRTVGDIWFYGTSEVHFNKGVVVFWYSSPSHPLKAK